MFWCSGISRLVCEGSKYIGAVFLYLIPHAFGEEFGLKVSESFVRRAFFGTGYLCNFREEEVISGQTL